MEIEKKMSKIEKRILGAIALNAVNKRISVKKKPLKISKKENLFKQKIQS